MRRVIASVVATAVIVLLLIAVAPYTGFGEGDTGTPVVEAQGYK